jgi:hypothetical protein
MRTTKIWKDIENLAEGTAVSCMLSKHPFLLTFMQYIFVRLTRVMYGAFSLFSEHKRTKDIHADAIQQILAKYKPLYDREFLLRPGLDSVSDDILIELIEEIVQGDCNFTSLHHFTLNQIMGAVYGVSTDRLIIGKILLASTFTEFRKVFSTDVHPKTLQHITETIKTIFGVPSSFSRFDLLHLIGYPTKENTLVTMLLDMMVYKLHGKSVSIVRRNLNNLPYIRIRSDKQQTEYKQYSSLPYCPLFHTKNSKELKLVHGNSWYYVPNGSIMRRIMRLYGRKVKAGISGSTLMWLNLCFHVVGIEETRENIELLLLCIISDFVPRYHSLSEILMVYSKESQHALNHPYFIDESPIKWLIDELQAGRTARISETDFLHSLSRFISRTYSKVHTNLQKTKCIHANIKIDSSFKPIDKDVWKNNLNPSVERNKI